MSDIVFHRHSDRDALAAELADWVAGHLRAALDGRPEALLVVSGGSTPVPFFDALSQRALPWERVTVTLADERWVPPDDPQSNERLVRRHLLQRAASAARFLPLKTDDGDATAGARRLDGDLARLPWPADVLVLGVGSDGHTASLFPDQYALWHEASVRCLAVPPPSPPNPAVARVTLTPAVLRAAAHVAIHACGDDKLRRIETALRPGPVGEAPLRLVLQRPAGACHVFHAP